jgi:hypothetical protein
LTIFVIVLWASGAALAQTQPGNIGGSVGKQDKSVSGGEEKLPSIQPRSKQQKNGASDQSNHSKRHDDGGDGCANVVGIWHWHNGVTSDVDINFKTDGLAYGSNGDRAPWSCTGGQLVLTWQSSGAVERLTLSSDRTRLSGGGKLGILSYSISAVRN